MIKLVIFDLDGTLLDTLQDMANACNYALRQCSCPERKLEEYNLLVGRGINNLFRGALPEDRRNEEMVLNMRNHFIPYYNEHICDYTRPYPGILHMLDRLSQEGIRFAVASNKYQEGTEVLVNKIFSGYDMLRISGQENGRPIKPDPAIIHEIMEEMPGLLNEETIYCGDSDVDMQTGQNAGVKTIGVTWGFRSRKELEAYSPYALAETPEQLTEIILK